MIFKVQYLPKTAGRRVVRRSGNYAIFSLMLAGQIHCLAQLPLSGTALANVKVAAEAGDPAAEDQLALQFMFHGDSSQALIWYGKAAEHGYVPAQGKLGDLLLLRARSIAGTQGDTKTTIGSHAINWLILAAYQGDTLAQADLAGACLNGEFVTQDLLEAYKWGDLAARGGSLGGQSIRDSAILKMSTAQLAEAKQRVAKFIPHLPGRTEFPEPAWVKEITLTGLSGTTNCPLAIINSVTFGVGDLSVIKVAGKAVAVRCLQIRDKSVLVQIQGLDMARELILQN